MASRGLSNYIDARRSNFTSVGRDQNNFHVGITVNLASQHVRCAARTRRRQASLLSVDNGNDGDDVSHVRSKRRKLSSSTHCCSPDDVLQWPTGSAGAVADNFIVQIVQLLIDRGERGTYCRILELDLEPLRQTLSLTNLAMRTYERTPLGQNLERSIIPVVEQICVVLQELFDKISNYRQALWPTSIRRLWHEVWWRGRELDDGLVFLRSKVAARQQLLGSFLMALNSVSWTEFGNGMCSGHVPLKYLHSRIKQGPLSLRHIQVDVVTIVDHLGRNIPMPILFCSGWTVFNYIINGYCKDRPGNRFVERGDYQVLRADDSETINRLEIGRIVQPGMVLEMSIVIHRSTTLQDNEKKCPRCSHLNLNTTVTNSWIECCNCSGKFQIATADPNDGDGDEEGDRLDEGDNDKEHMENADDGKDSDEGRGKDMASPDTRMGNAMKASGSRRQRPAEDDDGTKFFRLIHVICKSQPEIFIATYRSVHELPQHVWDTLRADPHRSKALLAHAEKALTRPADRRECWITCSTSNPPPSSETIDLILSCTDSWTVSDPIFIYSTRHPSKLAQDFLLPRLSLLVKALHSAVSFSRIFSVFEPDPITAMFTELWANLTGIHPTPQPHHTATFSVCTKDTFIDKPILMHPSLTYDMRLAIESDIPSVAELCYGFAVDFEPFVLTREASDTEATMLVRKGQVWVHQIRRADDEAPEVASMVCTTRPSRDVTVITKVYTKSNWRKLGCSERLIRHICKDFLKTKKRAVTYVTRDHQGAERVCHRVGFVNLKDRPLGWDVQPWLDIGFDRDVVKLGHW